MLRINAQGKASMSSTSVSLKALARAVVRVGKGRGFVVSGGDDRYVITAAHVLSKPPPPHLMPFGEERSYLRFLGPRGGKRKRIAVECLFYEPVSDTAVLGEPQDVELSDEAERYRQFVADLPPFAVAAPPPMPVGSPRKVKMIAPETLNGPVRFVSEGATRRQPSHFPAHVISLAGEWTKCDAARDRSRPGLLEVEPENVVVGGMSGSPLISATGEALGVVSTSNFCPVLTDSLPAWLLRKLIAPAKLR
jgi:hypothetical protein